MPHIVFDTELDFAYAKADIRDHIKSFMLGKEASQKGFKVKLWQVLVEVDDQALKTLEEKKVSNWKLLEQ